jgi:non-lysosomal glucosylceramidase
VPIRIPDVAWSWPIGAGVDVPPRPRVTLPMIDDGPWAGVPIGGIGAGSIGRTQRGDFARWHLRLGEHRFASEPLDGFAVWADDHTGPVAVVLRTPPPPDGWGPSLAVGAGRYRALFPRAWFEYEPEGLPIRVVEEQLSPVIPGDEAASTLPVGTFELALTNPTEGPVDAAILLSWRDVLGELFAGLPVRAGAFSRDGTSGVRFAVDGEAGSFAITAGNDDGLAISTTIFRADAPGVVWQHFARDGGLPEAIKPSGPASGALTGELAAALSVRLTLAPGETRSIRFAVAWDLPVAQFGSGRAWRRRYVREWGTSGRRADELAGHALRAIPDWRAAIEAWQAPILAATNRPAWYKAALFNELYFLVDGGTIWHDGPVEPVTPLDARDRLHRSEDLAELALIECFDYPFYDTLDVHFYAAFAVSRLFPRLQASISRAFAASVAVDDPTPVVVEATGEKAPRKVAGALPHDLGGPADDPLVRVNHYHFQESNGWKDLNPKFVLQAWRDRGDDPDPAGYLATVWPAVRAAIESMTRFDLDGDGLPEHDGPDQTYDTWPMRGPSAYGGSLWLGALRAGSAMARAVGEEACAVLWDELFERASASFEALLWNGRSYDYDASGGPTSDSVMADQLVGQWYADTAGLGDIVPAEHARSVLRRIHELNVGDFGDGLIGAVNGMRPDGTVDRSSEQSQEVWTGTSYALAAFMIGRGLVDEGWSTAEGVARVTYERGLWFRTPEAYDREGNFRASMYLRPLAIWAIEEALERRPSPILTP